MAEGYRPVRTLSTTLVVMLIICGVLGGLGALLGLLVAVAFPQLAGAEAPGSGVETGVAIGVGCQALLYLAAYLATVVVFAMFVHRCCSNAHALGARGMEFTPGWAVGWYFIPFMNLVKPYQAVQEIYRATDPQADADDWKLSYVPSLFGWWWGLWIVSNVLGSIVGRAALSSDPAALAVGPWLDVVDGVIDVALCTIAILMVRALTARQEQKARVASFA
jgi:hypothetical protein